MIDEEGPQASPAPQGAHDPLASQNPPPPDNPQVPIVHNTPQAPPAWKHFIYPLLMCPY